MTRIYGQSDDLIEFDGDVAGECGSSDASVVCSDGTVLRVTYGKGPLAIWQIVLLRAGDLFDRIEQCTDEEAELYSDIVHFKAGLKWALTGDLEKVR